MILRLSAMALALATFSGCAINQAVIPVAHVQSDQVCIIENPRVKSGFINAYRSALFIKGYAVRQLVATASPKDCPLTSTYIANWKWDMAMYMAYADIVVYKDGKLAGRATYDSTGGGANMNKFINADKKIAELVDQLFPAYLAP